MALKVEQEHHKRAFEVYYAQGAKRSYEKVAKELGVSTSTVKLWSHSFGWPRRIAERDATAARQIADRSLQSTADELSRNKKFVTMALLKVAKAIAEGKVRVQMADLDRLIRLDQILSGVGPDGSDRPGLFRSQQDVEAFLESLTTHELELLSGSGTAKRGDNSDPTGSP